MGVTEVIVGRIGRAHGVHGEVSVEPSTDEPERRFADGAPLALQTPAGAAPRGTGRPASVTVRAARRDRSRLLVSFEEVADRTAAEALRGLVLVASVDRDETPEDAEEFYDHHLLGLRVRTEAGAAVGEVSQVVHGPAQDLLGVLREDGHEVLVPFVSQLVPTVDVPNATIVVVDRPGLLSPAETQDGD